MYAVVATGGKQYRVQVGDELDVERIPRGPAGVDDDGTVALRPVLLVDDDGQVTADRDALAAASVRASVVDERRGPKIAVFTYRNKTGYRRMQGHRQPVTRIRVDAIET